MVDCPECGSFNIDEQETEYGERTDDEHSSQTTPCECLDCHCKFDHIERWESETEVTTHGDQYVDEDLEEEKQVAN